MSSRYILWDFDGTIAYRDGMWGSALFEALTELEPSFPCEPSLFGPHLQSGFPWHTPERDHLHITTDDAWWQALFPVFERAYDAIGLPTGRCRTLAREVRRSYLNPKRWQIFEDVLPTLEELHSGGWNHAILSNHVPELQALVGALGLSGHFVEIFSSAALGYEKPHPAAFEKALTALGAPDEVWMVGDSYAADIIGAQRARIPSVLVRSAHHLAPKRCESLFELSNVITA